MTLKTTMNLAEEFIKYLIRHVMEHNREDLEFLAQRLAEEEKTTAPGQTKRNGI